MRAVRRLRNLIPVLSAFWIATLLVASTAIAQTYPDRPIRLVVPFPPGGGTDIAARFVGERMAERLGQQVIIDNRPGANGVVAGEAVVRAAPDGYTLLVATAAGFAAAPAIGTPLPYDVVTDFTPVGLLGRFPLVLVVNPDLPARTMQEFVALVRSRPGQLNYASAGIGGTNHIIMEMIADKAGLKMVHVPYRGAAPAAADLMGGQVQAMVDSMAAALGNIQAGRVRALGVTTAARQPQIPEVPTLVEGGVDLVNPSWASIVGPAKLPAAVVDRLSVTLAAIFADEAVRARYLTLGIEPVHMGPDELGRFMIADKDRQTAIARAADIKPE